MAKKRTTGSGTLGSRSRSEGAGGHEDKFKPTDELEVIKHFKAFLKANESHCRTEWEKAEENQGFVAGGKKQWNEKAYNERTANGKPTFSLNDCELATRAFSGREMTERFEPTFLAPTASDAPVTEMLRQAVRFIRKRARADNVESHGFRDLGVDNYSVLEWSQDYSGDEPHGRTKVDHNPLWEYVWDKRAREICFTDRAADARGYYVNIDEFLMLFPDKREQLKELMQQKQTWVSENTQVAYRHPWSIFAVEGQFVKRDENQIFLVSYHWREREPAWLATVPAGMGPHPVGADVWGQLCQAVGLEPGTAADAELWAQLKPALEQAAAQGLVDPKMVALARPRLMKMSEEEFTGFSEQYAAATGRLPDAMTPEEGQFRWARYEAMIVGDTVIRRRRLPFRHFPRIFMTSVPFSQMTGTTMQSFIEGMKSPQEFKNFVVSLATSHLQRSLKMGIVVRPNSLENQENLETVLSQPFWMLTTRPGVEPANAVQVIDGAGFPAGLDAFLQMADAAAWKGTGMNPATLGGLSDPRRVSGTVFNSLRDQVDSILSWEQNSLKTMRVLSAELIQDFLVEYHDRDDLEDMVGPEKAHLIPHQAEWRHAFRYDAIIEEVAVSRSEQEAQWDYWSRQGTMEKGIAAGYIPPWLMALTIPDTWVESDVRQKWIAWLNARGMGPDSPVQPPAPPGGGEESQQGGAPAQEG